MDQPSLSGLLKAADLPKIKGGPPPFAGMSEFTALDQPLIQDFLDHDRMGAALSAELRNQMAQFMGASEKENFTPPVPGLTPYAPGNATHVSSLVPALTALAHFIIEELENQLGDLVRINRSRREAIAQYLDRLAGHLPGPGGAVGGTDTLGSLGRWLSSARTPAQNAAFQTFFEEIALITLGRAILLKAWSDRGIRAWCEADLGKVNTLNEALRPKIPLDREGWQITSQNIYTWYNPSPRIQREIWTTLENLRITDEGPSFLMSLLRPARQAKPPVRESEGYDPRFFDAIWKTLPRLGFPLQNLDAGPLKRSRVFFTPTLRDGAAVRTGPVTAHWIALESSPFQLMMAELVQLWWGPAAPPLWAIGTGLDVHRGEQLALALGSPKPSVLSRITEMEACDLAVVLEEKIIRGQGRTSEALRFREQADAIPALKKLRSASTSLGDIQAGIALSKLRPGGLLLWAREEALAAKDGNEMLGSLLERAKIVCEWDFSELEHSLPGAIPLFPKHLYLLAREPRLQERLGHRPLKVSVKGQIRSHVELPLMLEDALMALQNPPSPRGHWEVRPHKSPTTQKDWAERWPDPACKNADRLLDRLRAVSLPLANFGNVKNTPAGDPAREGAWSLDPSLKGFWIRAEARALIAQPLPRLGREAKGSGFVVLVADESWVAPLIAYLQSEPVRVWLDHHAERRADRWMLDEQTARCLPIPRSLLKALGAQSSDQPDATDFALPLPGEWEKLAADVAYQPKLVRDSLPKLTGVASSGDIQAAIFIRAANALETLRSGQNKLLSIVSPEGSIRWRDLMDSLGKGECTSVTLHPGVKMTGSIPANLPIHRIEKVRMPSNGILMMTEAGFSLHLGFERALLLDMLWDQLQGLEHPTWGELVNYLKLPRSLERAEREGSEILRAHGIESGRLRELTELLSACSLV